MKYPETRRVDQTDEFFGVKVPDPYRWLEADIRESPEVAEWAKKQNEVARKYLDAIPQRAAIEKRLTELWNYERYGRPCKKAASISSRKNDGLQNQRVLYVADSYKSEGRVLVDPNTWSKDGTVAMTQQFPATMAGYWHMLAPKPAATGSKFTSSMLPPERQLTSRSNGRATHIGWAKDGSGFYYNRYPEPPQGESHQALAAQPDGFVSQTWHEASRRQSGL